jgi:hypothetical protein
MTDISLYKNVSLPHDKYRIAKILAKGKLVENGDISISKVVDILLTREAKSKGISAEDIAKVEVGNRKKKKKLNNKRRK